MQLKGSKQPMKLFTYDVDLDKLDLTLLDSEQREDELLQWAPSEWLMNPDLSDSWGLTTDFKRRFDAGFAAYRAGNWAAARTALEECRVARRDALSGRMVVDRPSEVLLEYMEEHRYVAPAGWQGYRALTEK